MIDVSKVAVIGAGLLGHGIAQEFATSGFDVGLHDLSEEILAQAKANMARNLQTLAEAGLVDGGLAESVPGRVRTSTDLEEVVRDADFVIEAVSEDLPLKQRVFGELDRLCRHHTILASNSSTFMPSSLASATGRPDKVLVTHYFNPPYLVPAVEIVRHEGTSDETFDTAFALFQQIGKRPVRVQKEALGFIGNRLQAALVRECFSLVDKGIASAEDIDAVVRYGLGRRLSVAGPLEIADVAGLDIYSTLMSHILPDLDAATSPPQALAENVRDGNLGVKTGQGTYSWTPESSEETRQRIANALIEIQKWSA